MTGGYVVFTKFTKQILNQSLISQHLLWFRNYLGNLTGVCIMNPCVCLNNMSYWIFNMQNFNYNHFIALFHRNLRRWGLLLISCKTEMHLMLACVALLTIN